MRTAHRLALAATLALFAVAGPVETANAYDVTTDLAYSNTHADLVFDWYRPAGTGPHPAVVFIHGAHLASGDKSDVTKTSNQFLLDMLLAGGVTVFSINVRPFPEFIYPAQLDDGAEAMQFFRFHASTYQIDPSRVILWGHSGGAMIGGWLTYGDDYADVQGTPQEQLSSRPFAFVNSAGLTNFLILHPSLPGWMFGKNTLADVDQQLLLDTSFSEQVLNVTRPTTPPVVSLYPGQESSPPLLDVHDATMMKVLHQNLETGFPTVAAASLQLTRKENPIPGVNQELAAAWMLDLFALPSEVIELSQAMDGTTGPPTLSATGDFTAGGAFTLEIQAARNAPTLLWVVTGEERVQTGLFGGTLVPDAKIVLPLPSGVLGHLTLSGVVPAIAPPGHSQYLQVWHQDPAGPQGWAATNALKINLY